MLSAKQIEIFYEVYRTSSMTAAAKRLQISQPSVSKTLRVIEKNLNFKLFLREGKKLIPSIEADDLYEHASVVHSQLKSFNAIANTYKTRSIDYINIGTTPSLADSIIPQIIKKYNKINSEVKFNLINLNSIDLIEDRYKPEIDLTICYNSKPQSNTTSTILKKGMHKLVSPKSYHLSNDIDLKDISHLPFIEVTNLLSFYEKSSISEYIKNENIMINTIIKTDSYNSALSLVDSKLGISILDENTCKKANQERVTISNILGENFLYTIYAIKKDIVRNECNDFFNYLSQQVL
jgi:DNA-binding transcriptional LysR family regulator